MEQKKKVKLYIETSNGSETIDGMYDCLNQDIVITGEKDNSIFSSYQLIVQNLIILYDNPISGEQISGDIEGNYKDGFTLSDDEFKNNLIYIYSQEYAKKLKENISNAINGDETFIDKRKTELEANYNEFKAIPALVRQYMKDGSIISNEVKVNTFTNEITFSKDTPKENISLQELSIQIDAIILNSNITPGYKKINSNTQELLLTLFEDNIHRIESIPETDKQRTGYKL